MECQEEYVRKITTKYNKRHATTFVHRTSEKKFLGPWGLALKRHPPPGFGNQCARLDRKQEFQLFAASHFMKYRLKICSKRQIDRYLEIYIALRNRGVSANWRLVFSCATRHAEKFCGKDLSHLLENGYLILIAAVDGFDPWRGYKFSTYACNAITKSFYYQSKNSRLKVEQLNETIDIAAPCQDDNIELWVERLKKTLKCTSLTKKEIEILAYRFGCFDFDEPIKTLGEVGAIWGLTKERVRQIQRLAIAKLRDELYNDPFLS